MASVVVLALVLALVLVSLLRQLWCLPGFWRTWTGY
jgi:hypothetical protein